jgi:hypothetical protein
MPAKTSRQTQHAAVGRDAAGRTGPDPSSRSGTERPAGGTDSLAVLDALAAGPASGSALARRLGRRKRDVLRDLAALVGAGSLVRDGRGRAGRFRVATVGPAPGSDRAPGASVSAAAALRVVVVAPCVFCAEDGGCRHCGGTENRRCVHCWTAVQAASA